MTDNTRIAPTSLAPIDIQTEVEDLEYMVNKLKGCNNLTGQLQTLNQIELMVKSLQIRAEITFTDLRNDFYGNRS